jgi:Histidine kinase-, DNA gyrase B-, and HSP90-like ATPase
MKLNLRSRLLVALCPLFAVPALLAGLGLSVPIVLVGSLACVAIAAAVVYWLTMPFDRLRNVAKECLNQVQADEVAAEPAWGEDGTGMIASALATQFDRLEVTEQNFDLLTEQFKHALGSIATTLNSINAEGQYPPLTQQPTDWTDINKATTAAIARVANEIGTNQRKAVVYNSFLNDCPDPLVILDDTGRVVSWNIAAAKLYPGKDIRKKRVEFGQLFSETTAYSKESQADLKIKTRGHMKAWLGNPGLGICETIAANDEHTPLSVSVLHPNVRKSGPYTVVGLRDLSSYKQTELADRLQQRKIIGQRLCLLVDNEAKPCLGAMRTQASLIAQASKQVGQREKFVPKVERLLEELGRQEVVIDLLGWLGRLTKSFGTATDNIELRLLDVVQNVADKLEHSVKERNNTLNVTGDAGWLIADEDGLTSMVTGLLMHANQATEKNAISLKLQRRSVPGASGEQSEVVLNYTGKLLSPDQIKDICEPFRRVESVAFDSSATQGGFFLGLAVANRIAVLMGQELEFTSEGNTQIIRAVLSTRETGSRSSIYGSKLDTDYVPGAEASDMLAGWDVGGFVSPADPVDTPLPRAAAEAMPAATEIEFVATDTVDNWFGKN